MQPLWNSFYFVNHRLLDVFLLLHMITTKFNHSCHLPKLQLFYVMHESGRHLTEMTHRGPSVSLEKSIWEQRHKGGMGWVRVRIKCKVKVIVIWGDNIFPCVSHFFFDKLNLLVKGFTQFKISSNTINEWHKCLTFQ